MKKDRIARIITLLVLLLAVTLILARKTGWHPAQSNTSQNPEDAIYAMLDAARAGNVRAYLANYTGQMQATLQQSLAETKEAAFAEYLKNSNASIKGVAVSDAERISDVEAKVRVEYIYQDRNEAQTVYLEKSTKGWKISRVDNGERVKTLIPYGTPVK